MAIDNDDGPDMAWFEEVDWSDHNLEDDRPSCPVCGGTRLVQREEEDRDTGYRGVVIWCLDCDDLGE